MTHNKVLDLTPEALGDELVIIKIGSLKNQKSFALHKKLLCNRSQFFSNAFNGGFQEAKEGAIDLVCDDPEIFHLFFNYIYQGGVAKFPNDNFPEKDTEGEENYDRYSTVTVCLDQLMNMVMDNIQDVYTLVDGVIDPTYLIVAYKTTPNNSHLRTYCTLLSIADAHQLDSAGNDRIEANNSLAGFASKNLEFAYDFISHSMSRGHELDICRDTKKDPRHRSIEKGLGPHFFHKHAVGGKPCYLDGFEARGVGSGSLKRKAMSGEDDDEDDGN